MKSFALILTAFFTLTLIVTGCSKEEKPATPRAKPAAIQAAENAAAAANLNAGQRIYRDSCSSCHDSGLLGAPKLGDKAAWADHMQYGLDHMVQKAITGVGSMPAKGGNSQLGDHDIKMAVEYMVKQSR
jgi:cytochrome c5